MTNSGYRQICRDYCCDYCFGHDALHSTVDTNTLMDIRFVYTAVQTNLDNALCANGNHGESFTKPLFRMM